MIRVYLDTNVLAFSLQMTTNSRKIFRLALDQRVEVVISDYLIEETRTLIMRLYGKDSFSKLRYSVEQIPNKKKIYVFDHGAVFQEFSKIVVDKNDLPHICSYVVAGAEYFVTTNRKLTQEKVKSRINFITPKKFIELLGLESFDTENEE